MPGPKSDKRWADALSRAVHRESAGKGSPKWIEVIAMRVVEEAADGDMAAVKEVGERLDGKPSSNDTLTHKGSVSLNLTKRVVRDD